MDCAILIGLPASGKTTFYRTHLAKTHVHVSKDVMRHARGRDQKQRRSIDEALASGHNVAVDNTNPTIAGRAPLIALARAHAARVVGYFFETSVREAVGRNAGREGKTRVPNVAIFTAAKKLQPPTLSEGFDRLFSVRVAGEGRFEIADYV